MVIELQAEPWANGSLTDVSLDEQWKTMNAEQLMENVRYARQVGFSMCISGVRSGGIGSRRKRRDSCTLECGSKYIPCSLTVSVEADILLFYGNTSKNSSGYFRYRWDNISEESSFRAYQ